MPGTDRSRSLLHRGGYSTPPRGPRLALRFVVRIERDEGEHDPR
jgi:hypothetical protein